MRRVALTLAVLVALGTAGAAAAPVESGVIDGPFGDVRLGGVVSFGVSTTNVRGNEYPMVQVDCSQDVLVWSTLIAPDETVKLGGDASDWVRASGEADCTAYLLVFGSHGRTQTIGELDSLTFHAGG